MRAVLLEANLLRYAFLKFTGPLILLVLVFN